MDYIEADCVIEHNGRKLESGGAIVTPDRIVAYPARDPQEHIAAWRHDASGPLHDWHGRVIGDWREVARWRVNSYVGAYMRQIEARVDGVVYTGRGFGIGMVYFGKRRASQVW